MAQDEDNWLKNFAKSDTDRWIGGVCGGLGEHTSVPSWLWRLLFVLLVVCYGMSVLVYVVLWIFVPRKTPMDSGKNADDKSENQ